MRRDHLREGLVRFDVSVPVTDVERDLIEQIMKERPEHAVREPLVEPAYLLLGEGHVDQAHRGQLLFQPDLLLGREPLGRARPSDPEPVGLLVRPHEPRGQPPHAPRHLDTPVRDADGDRKPVGDDEKAGHGM